MSQEETVSDAPIVENVDETCGACPNQLLEGLVNKHPFYFRARHGHWTLQVAPIGRDGCADGGFVAEGSHPMAGWWDEAEARAALDAAIQQAYVAGTLPK